MTLERLKGDASSRQYFRGKNFIKAVYPSELRDSFYNYLKWYKIYKKHGIPVPELYDVDTVNLEMLVEDCGDINGVDYLKSLKLSLSRKKFVSGVYDLIKIIQSIPEKEEIDAPVLDLKRELDFFREQCICALVPESFSDFLQELTDFVAANLQNTSQKLAHRDFHFRNILVKDGKFYLIDFQDTLFAPEHYDSASLMFDAYFDLEKLRALEKHIDTEEYRFVGLQINLKALGTFCKFGLRGDKQWFRDSIPNALNYVSSHLSLLNKDFLVTWENLKQEAFKNI